MTIDECREHVGDRVAYHRKGQLAEEGVITGAGMFAFVRYDGNQHSSATKPEDLTLLEQPS